MILSHLLLVSFFVILYIGNMRIIGLLYTCIMVFVLSACNTQDRKDDCFLSLSNEYLSFPVSSDTYLPYRGIEIFSVDNKEYLAYRGSDRRTIFIYELLSGKPLKCVRYSMEGGEGIGKIGEIHIEDFDHIYITTPYKSMIYRTDTTGVILQKINYDKTSDDIPVELETIAGTLGPIVILDSKIYIPQDLNMFYGNELVDKSKVGVVIDTIRHTVELLPVGFPHLINYLDIGTSAGFGCFYNRCFGEDCFVYGFLYSDIMYKTSIDHKNVIKKHVRSKYISKIDVFRTDASNFNQMLKQEAELAVYGDCLYDRYRKVYYRFAYPSSELENNDSYLEILRNGRKQFSIIILNENLEIIGETLFPEFAFSNRAHFVREDGLYLSVSHFKRKDFSEDELRFQRLDLVYNKK